MNLSVTKFTNGILITMRGHMDSVQSPLVAAELERIVEERAAVFAFHCSDLTYVSSAGLRVFLQIAKKVKSTHRAKIALTALTPSVLEVFEIAGFTTMYHICDSPAELRLGREA